VSGAGLTVAECPLPGSPDCSAYGRVGSTRAIGQVGTAKANRAPVFGVVSECWLSYHRQAPDPNIRS
jgi:hypothetical protein